LDSEQLEQLKKIDLDLFPVLIKDFIELIGYEPALKIFVTYSGRYLRVPSVKTTSGKLELLIGLEAFKKLSHTYGNETVQIPSLRKLNERIERKKRNDSIIEEWCSKTVNQSYLAEKYSLTLRTINFVISEYKKLTLTPTNKLHDH